MRTIELDASLWNNHDDFYSTLLKALGSPEWHGTSVNALVDSIVFGEINDVEPPLCIRFSGLRSCPAAIRETLVVLKQAIRDARADYLAEDGVDRNVTVELFE